MLTIKKFALMFCLMMGLTVIANAQNITSGTVNFTVTTPPAFDIRSNGQATVGSGVQIQNNSIANSALSVSLLIGDAGPGSTNALTASVPIRLRSNAAYKVTATRTGVTTQADNDPAAFDASDINMSLSVQRNAGGLVASGTDTPNASITKLSNIAKTTGSTVILNGDRISNQGTNAANSNNYITATLQFNMLHQYYSVGNYAEQIYLGISANP